MISQTQFVLLGYEKTNYNFHMYKLSFFSATSVDWANKMVCSSGSWTTGISEMLLQIEHKYICVIIWDLHFIEHSVH